MSAPAIERANGKKEWWVNGRLVKTSLKVDPRLLSI